MRDQGFVDEAIVSEMLSGIEDDSKCRRGTLLCAPHVGGLKSYQQMLKKTKASVEAGWASGGYTSVFAVLANQIVPYVSGGRVCAGREAQVAADD